MIQHSVLYMYLCTIILFIFLFYLRSADFIQRIYNRKIHQDKQLLLFQCFDIENYKLEMIREYTECSIYLDYLKYLFCVIY